MGGHLPERAPLHDAHPAQQAGLAEALRILTAAEGMNPCAPSGSWPPAPKESAVGAAVRAAFRHAAGRHDRGQCRKPARAGELKRITFFADTRKRRSG